MPIRPIESPLTVPPPLTAPPKEESPERTVQEADNSVQEKRDQTGITGNMMDSAGDSPDSETSSVIRHESDLNDEQSEERERTESPEREAERPISENRQKGEISSESLKSEVESQIRMIKQTIQQTVPFI